MKRSQSAPAGRQPKAKAKVAKAPESQATSSAPSAFAGPRTLQEGFQWPTDMVRAVCLDEHRKRRLMIALQKMWHVGSDYSGLRTEEVAFAALDTALKEVLGQELKHDFIYSCDSDATCQSLTLGTRPDRKPAHCFKDLNGWLTSLAESHLDSLETNLPQVTSGMTKEEKEQVNKQRGERYEYMGTWLKENIKTAFNDDNACLQHMQDCKLDFEQPPEGQECLLVAGVTCIAWSIMGKHEGFGHTSMRPFFIWCCHIRRKQPVILVIESAKRFPRASIESFLSDLYHLVFFDLPGPMMHGWPIGRPRMWRLGFLRSKVTFMGSVEEYEGIFTRTLHLDGDHLFFLDLNDPDVVKEKRALAQSRHQQADVLWEELYPPNRQKLVTEHKRMYADLHSQGARCSDRPPAYICDLDQNIGFMSAGQLWPTLVRHGCIFSLVHGRHALPAEKFAAQGFPVHKALQSPYACGFQQFYEQDLSAGDCHKLIGNAMFVPTLASMILYAMSSAEFQPALLIRPMSRNLSLSEIEDSQSQELH